MKISPPQALVSAVAVTADAVQFDCPLCDATHELRRSLDYTEDRDGVWRTNERPGFECDCGALIRADFRICIADPPDTEKR